MSKNQKIVEDKRSAEQLAKLKEDYDHAADVAQCRDWRFRCLSSSSDEEDHPIEKKGEKGPGVKA